MEAAFSLALRESRRRASVSQERLSFMCGLDRTYISRLERGLSSPSLRTLFAIADALGTTPDAILAEMRLVLAEEERGSRA